MVKGLIRVIRFSSKHTVALQVIFFLLLAHLLSPAAGMQQASFTNDARDLYREVLFVSEKNIPVKQYQDTIAFYENELERMMSMHDQQHSSTSAILTDAIQYLDMVSALLNDMKEKVAINHGIEGTQGDKKPAETTRHMEPARGFAARNLEVLVSAGILTVLLIVMISINKHRLSSTGKKISRSKQVKPKSHYQIKKELFASGKEKGKIKI